MEYIICEKNKISGNWALFCLAGFTEEEANTKLEEKRKLHPELELDTCTVASEDCWWRFGCD